MAKLLKVGKRDFLLNSNKYLKVVEEKKQELIVTYRNKPVFKISPVSANHLDELKGLITDIEVDGEITDPVFEEFDKWSS